MTTRDFSLRNTEQNPWLFLRKNPGECSEYLAGGLAAFALDFTSPIVKVTQMSRSGTNQKGFGCSRESDLSKFLRPGTGQTGLESAPSDTISHGEGETDANDDHDSNNEGPNIRQ